MCGIVAIISQRDEIPPDVIEVMTSCLHHRGPDEQASIRLTNCHLGHTRLSIIDLVGGAQPMMDETGRYWIVFNGEIYTYRELRVQLESLGHRFRTSSDTEVLLVAYQQYGEAVLRYLNGQFAFVIWDKQEERLFAARDRMGEKPLYWAESSDSKYLLFASEIKSLLASGLVSPQIDPLSVDTYLALYYVPPDRTIYSNVHTLKPGSAISWQEGQWHTWRYWEPSYSQSPISDSKEIIEQLRYLIAQAVRRQMVADVPVGAFLSGGLDSSTIVALMTKNASNNSIMTFSVGFSDLIDELPYAQAVAQAYHTDHYELQMDIPVGEMLECMARVYDEPFADSSNIPTYLVSEFASHHVKVVLSGDGGDELFGGYAWYRPLLENYELQSTAKVALARMASLVLRGMAKARVPVREQCDGVARYFEGIYHRWRNPDLWDYHLWWATQLKLDRTVLWGSQVAQETATYIRRIYAPNQSIQGMDRATDFDIRCYLPGDILVKVDRAAMAHGLETRAPFLDPDLVEFVLGLSWTMRFFDPVALKYLLRSACGNLWPLELDNRPKQGFGAPIEHWIQRPDVQPLMQRVTRNGSSLEALLPGLRTVLPDLTAQQKWTVLCLGLWLEQHSECLKWVS